MHLLYRSPLLLRPPWRCGAGVAKRWSSSAAHDALRILFCGSDEFSIASLKALAQEHRQRPDLIKSIDVVCRLGKPVGRGLKKIREVPIKGAATELGLPIHEIDTFTGWTPPNGPIDLIIAVSFGLFVPPRLLRAATYGGLNVHPSLLPDFRGPAPLHHTLLAGRRYTGITLQTLHEKHFDHGVILDQTPPPGLEIPNPDTCTVQDLLAVVAPKGAEMLVQGIRNRLYVPPLKPAGWRAAAQGEGDLIHAAKITPADRHVDWRSWSSQTIRRRLRVLGPLWNTALTPGKSFKSDSPTFQSKRIILNDIEEVADRVPGSEAFALLPGVPFIRGPVPTHLPKGDKSLYVYSSDGKLLRLREVKVEGDQANNGFVAALKARMLSPRTVRIEDREFGLFYNPLS